MGNHVGRGTRVPVENEVRLNDGTKIKAWYDFDSKKIKARILDDEDSWSTWWYDAIFWSAAIITGICLIITVLVLANR